MNKIVALAAGLAVAATAAAQTEGSIKIIIPEGTQEIAVAQIPIDEMYSGAHINADTIDVTGQTVYELPLDPDEAMAVVVRKVARPAADGSIPAADMRVPVIYAAPGETLTLDFTTPIVDMKGSPLMEAIGKNHAEAMKAYKELMALGENATEEQQRAVIDNLNADMAATAAANPENAIGVYFTNMISDPELKARTYALLGAGAKTSILAPMYNQIGKDIERQRARAAAAEKVKVGLEAPAFTLPDADGKEVSLADFKGKWVMLDFWGTWCGWCIKGIPQMKEEWEQLKDRNMVFLSVACGDPKEKWLDALKKYELSWVNVWNDPQASVQVSSLYAVSGFPTKMVVDPEGKIALIVVGEDPSFYDQVKALLK